MKSVKKTAVLGVLVMISGCAIVPYEEEVACRAGENYGKCVDIGSAYAEAVTGVEQGLRLEKGEHLTVGATVSPPGDDNPDDSRPTPYGAYRSAVYSELEQLIRAPVTPMVSPPKALRTLIVSYSKAGQKQTLYMPRFVYTIIEQPRWVMGEYLEQPPQPALTLPGFETP